MEKWGFQGWAWEATNAKQKKREARRPRVFQELGISFGGFSSARVSVIDSCLGTEALSLTVHTVLGGDLWSARIHCAPISSGHYPEEAVVTSRPLLKISSLGGPWAVKLNSTSVLCAIWYYACRPVAATGRHVARN